MFTSLNHHYSEKVTINKKSKLSTEVQEALADAVGDTNNYEDESFTIAAVKGGKGSTKYTYSLNYEGTLVTRIDGNPLLLEQKVLLPLGIPIYCCERQHLLIVANFLTDKRCIL